MRKLLAPALMFVCSLALAQTSRFPPINLYSGDPTGNVCSGNLIQQSSTTGLIYTCQGGIMKTGGGGTGTITGVTASSGITGGGSSGSVSLSCLTGSSSQIGCVKADGTTIAATAGTLAVQLSGLSGTAASLISGNSNQLLGSTWASPGAIGSTTPAAATFTTAKAATLGGSGYVSLWGNGTTNGIATCTASGGRCVADPTYPTTEQPYLFKFFSNQLSFPPLALSSFVDQRPGNSATLFRDAAKSAITGRNDFAIQNCGSTTVQSPTLGTAQVGASVNCHTFNYWWGAPGVNLGTAGVGPTGWSTGLALNLLLQTNGSGIDGLLGGTHYKAGIGDSFGSYIYSYNYGGAVAGSDEGHHLSGLLGGESNLVAAGTIATGGGGSGATTVQITCTNDCNNWGDGRYLINKTTGTSTGNVTAKANPSGFTPGSLTIDTPVTASTFWGTLNANVVTPIAAPLGVGTTSMTFVVNSGPGNVGSPAIGDLVCFAGQFHEQSKLTAVTGSGPWTVTAPLRHAHESGSWMMSNGPCGSFIDFTADHVTPNQLLRFPIDILGATSTTTLQYRFFSYLGNTNWYPGNLQFAQSSFGSLTNTANVVTFSSTTVSSQPWLFNIPTITISNATNSAFNGPCTSTAPDSLGRLTCTQAASNGQTSTTATVAVGASQYGNTAYTLYPGAEVLDVLDYNSTTCAAQSPALIAPCMDSKLTLEPNTVVWNNGDSVEEPHHYMLQTRAHHDTLQVYNPINPQETDADVLSLIGGGISGGNTGNVTLNWSARATANLNPASMYYYHGGTVGPPGGLSLEGTGPWNYGLFMRFAPDPPGSSIFYIGCPVSLCTDVADNYNVFTLTGNGGNATFNYVPNTNSLTLSTGTTSINIPRLAVSTAITLPNSGVTAGSCTFCSMTVGADGRVTAQSNNSSTAGIVVGSVGAANVSIGGLSNLVRNTATMAGASWTSTTVTPTAGQSDPYGGTNAVSLQSAATNASYADNGFTLTTSTTYTACGWVKGAAGGEGEQVLIGGNGIALSSITTAWKFYSITTAPTGTLTRTIGFFSTTATNQTIYLYGWGLTLGSSCSPWLPTSSAAVTTTVYELSAPSIAIFANQTTVSCSTSGTATFSQPETGASDKKVLIHLAACNGTASYTYPTAFTNTPSCYASSTVACSVAGTISTSAVTVTGAPSTGSLILEDY